MRTSRNSNAGTDHAAARRRIAFGLLGIVMMVAASRGATAAAEPKSAPKIPKTPGPSDRADGVYQANIDFDGFAVTSYQKTGKAVIGTLYNGFRNICYQGTLNSSTIKNDRIVQLSLDYSTRPPTQHAADLSADYPVGHLTTTPLSISLKFDVPLQVCLDYFHAHQSTNAEEPPCGDEQLRPTIPAAGQLATYTFPFAPICATKDSPNCTVPKVFAVMLSTPRAIAPVVDPDADVTNCGILELESFTNTLKPAEYENRTDNNYIRVEIDENRHRIINSTMPNHVFWPGRVIRQIVLRDGKVGVLTTGYGNENAIKKWTVNLFSSGVVWDRADGFLREAYEEQYGDD